MMTMPMELKVPEGENQGDAHYGQEGMDLELGDGYDHHDDREHKHENKGQTCHIVVPPIKYLSRVNKKWIVQQIAHGIILQY